MSLFHLYAEKEQDRRRSLRAWLVIAESLFEAFSLVPEGYSVKAAEVRVGTVSGRRRVLRWTASPRIH